MIPEILLPRGRGVDEGREEPGGDFYYYFYAGICEDDELRENVKNFKPGKMSTVEIEWLECREPADPLAFRW